MLTQHYNAGQIYKTNPMSVGLFEITKLRSRYFREQYIVSCDTGCVGASHNGVTPASAVLGSATW